MGMRKSWGLKKVMDAADERNLWKAVGEYIL